MILDKLNNSERKRAEFIRFCINGCVAVGVQYGVFWLMLTLGMEKNIAFTIGYIVSFCYNFIVTSYWTFKSRPSWKRFTGFAGSHVVNYIIQMAFLNIFCLCGLAEKLSGILAMIVAVPVNFLILRLVYRKNKKA